MHAGKHQEYERKLHDMLVSKMAMQSAQQQQQQQSENKLGKSKDTSSSTTSTAAGTPSKENWPQLNPDKTEKNNDKKVETNKEKAQKGKTKVKNGSECNINNNNNSSNKKPDKSKNSENQGQSGKTQSTQDGISNNKSEKNPHADDKIQNTARSKEGNESGDKTEKSSECSIPKIPILDDNSSFFSQNTFQKIAPDVEEDDSNLLSENNESQSQILNDSLPNINSTEDWEAAFGFSKHNNHMEELAKQRNNVKDTLETFGNGFNGLDMFGNLDNNYQNNYDATSKLQESILEALSNKHTHFGVQNTPQFSKSDRLNGLNGQFGLGSHSLNGVNGLNNLNGLDQQMSKFFSDFYKNSPKDMFNGIPNGLNTHGLNGLSQNGLSQPNGFLHNVTDRQNLLLLQQRQIEEQLMNLNIKQQTYNQQLLHNGLHSNQYMNSDILAQNGHNFGPLHNQLYQHSVNMGKNNSRPEDELDFDPFHETQKALAELMENEQSHKLHNAGKFLKIIFHFIQCVK